MDELKRCPFCGGNDIYLHDQSEDQNPREIRVICRQCYNWIGHYWREKSAINAWNNRPIEDALRIALSDMVDRMDSLGICEYSTIERAKEILQRNK